MLMLGHLEVQSGALGGSEWGTCRLVCESHLVFMKKKISNWFVFCLVVKKNRSKYSLLSVFITKVAVVAISVASVSAAHPGSPPPDCTASGQRFAICDWSACTASGQISAFARFLVNFSGGWQPRLQTWQTACQTTQTTCCAMRRLATSLTTPTSDLT